ncbi:MAG: hypothetical protein UR39_C0003G0041 [Candidatus Woesebacteria bacterium GW2011_GWA1_33_30]|uniref:Uncharacterized protein n=1 Tax=Candidatus Woesebacteria bacterium GW2011_GWA2_33_28 TaxID=1618561 RepID=A0A0F9ZTP9_9BACT|nr:MAG: hypothetical protein UR38_C0003G0044 [Candidatus Woesebacteria bacterium GW2011_GWA2_33_28]KKP48506.1 MAG: hypothetical protein UR39_C0003G0041 [Candidatus Woesebacteria bacterium GW2011_GWA1_33_30]KKP49645.1 MAG: hypothetical protein UR40_C0004G0044 [Microgenomates group bacterium GW2011_GWC1_33_32]KKP52262.1 MAG: hypothetical protein UR44_C0003G0044 [Candidatus Woesebacteria bacterium GW2011_GWB1_33_38]
MSTKKHTIKTKVNKVNKVNRKKIFSIVGLIFLIVAVLVGLYLVKQNQNIEEEAAAGCKYNYDRESCANACSTSKKTGKSINVNGISGGINVEKLQKNVIVSGKDQK